LPQVQPPVAEPAAGAAESTLEAVEAEVGTVAATATAPTKSKAAPQAPPPPVDNSLNAFSLIGTVLKSVLNSILALFGLKK
ncbi:MAG: hypothetical protein AAFR05_22695, partial [Bacteroidota bacterium]